MNGKKWDKRFLELAKLVGSWSKDPSTKVGAVIVDCNNRIISVGYNGFPKGVKDNKGGDTFIHQGLSGKSFDKTFVLNSDLKVDNIKLLDGLLTVNITKDTSKEVHFDID